MKNITFYGNCQIMAIKNSLSSHSDFLKKYSFSQDIPPVYLLTDNDFNKLKKILKSTDIFIYQTISNHGKYSSYSTEKLIGLLKKDAIKICLPDVYFTGFHPGSTYAFTKDDFATAILPPVYHDLAIMKLFMKNSSKKKTLSLLESENFYSHKEIELNFKESLKELKLRENYNNVDIKISDFIEENKFKGYKLFYTFNHPTDFIIKYLANKILKFIEEKEFTVTKNLFELDTFDLFTHKGVANYFNIKPQSTIKFNQKNFDLENYIDYIYDIYSKNTEHINNTFNHYKNTKRFGFYKYILKRFDDE